ncbi:MAG: N-acetylneuraminate synthase family protein [bacterium]|nr:N-acetylneuraminate synthase family protein [bacterium]
MNRPAAEFVADTVAQPITVAGRLVGPGQRPLLVAELANSHGGSVENAVALTRALANTGCGAIKYQHYTPEELLVKAHPKYDNFKNLAFTTAEWDTLVNAAREVGLSIIMDVFGLGSARAAVAFGVEALKVHTADGVNIPLLEVVGASGLPVLLSVGGSIHPEVVRAIRTLEEAGSSGIVLMHGFQHYPTELADTNLARLHTLQRRYQRLVGVMDHVDAEDEMALLVPLLAVAAGASVVEKHVTLNRAAKGVDYYSSMEPDEFAHLAALLERSTVAMGSPDVILTEAEQAYRLTMKKQLVALRPLSAGTVLTSQTVGYRQAPATCHSCYWEEAIGRRTVVDLETEAVITRGALEERTIVCIAVRMHSQRLPRKALLPVAGRPAIDHCIERCLHAREVEAVVLCTSRNPEDKVLIEVAERHGIPWIAGDEYDVMSRFLEAAERFEADNVVRITGDNILIDFGYLDEAVRYHRAMNSDYTNNYGLPIGTACEVISTRALRLAHRMAADPNHTEYMSWYLSDPRVFRLSEAPVPEELSRSYRLTIDTPEDLELIRRLVETLMPQNPAFGVQEIVKYLDAHPEVASINSHVSPKNVESAVNTSLLLERYRDA